MPSPGPAGHTSPQLCPLPGHTWAGGEAGVRTLHLLSLGFSGGAICSVQSRGELGPGALRFGVQLCLKLAQGFSLVWKTAWRSRVPTGDG